VVCPQKEDLKENPSPQWRSTQIKKYSEISRPSKLGRGVISPQTMNREGFKAIRTRPHSRKINLAKKPP
jgi:hypothetical protein